MVLLYSELSVMSVRSLLLFKPVVRPHFCFTIFDLTLCAATLDTQQVLLNFTSSFPRDKYGVCSDSNCNFLSR